MAGGCGVTDRLYMLEVMVDALTAYFDEQVEAYRKHPDALHYSRDTPFGRARRDKLARKLWAMRRGIVRTRKARFDEWLRIAVAA